MVVVAMFDSPHAFFHPELFPKENLRAKKRKTIDWITP